MKFYLTKVEFDQDDLNKLHDVIFNALAKEEILKRVLCKSYTIY